MDKSIIKSIKQDKIKKENYSRYLSRFIFMPLSKKTYYDITSISTNLNMKLKMLSECNKYPNSIITSSDVLNFINTELLKSNDDIMFVGLSEILRLFSLNDFESTLKTIIEIENASMNERRIYFPIFSCYENISAIVREYKEKNYHPILEVITDVSHFNKYEIYFYNERIDNCLENTRDYYNLILNYGNEKVSGLKIICNSPQILKLLQKENIIEDKYFLLNGFLSFEDICNYYIIDFNINKNYKFTEEDYRILKEYCNNRIISIEELINEKVGSTDELTLLNNLFSSGENYSILIWTYILNQNDNVLYDFLKIVYFLSDNVNTEEILNSIIRMITFMDLYNSKIIDNTMQLLEVRKKIVDLLIDKKLFYYNNFEFDDKTEDLFKDSYSFLLTSIYFEEGKQGINVFEDDLSIQDRELLKKSIKIRIMSSITGYSKFERQLMIWLLANDVIEIIDIKEKYADLYNYLTFDMDLFVKENSVNNYFHNYRLSKLMSKPLNEYISIKNEFWMNNDSKDIYSIFHKWYKSIDERTLNNVDNVYVFDGIGYEYASYMTYLISKNEKINISIKLEKALLPTITSINKNDILLKTEKVQWVDDFDKKIIHGNFYKYYINIEKSLTIIKIMVNKVLSCLKPGQKVCITSDHGSTVQHKIIKTSKIHQFSTSEHDGRCCKVTDDIIYQENNSDYLVFKDFSTKETWLLATGNISLYNTAKYEAHGGATLEEVCIPNIIITYDKAVNYSVTLLNQTINSINKQINFTINPQPYSSVYIMEENGNKIKCDCNNNIYTGKLSSGKAQNIVIKIYNRSFEFKIKNNSLNDEGDDFFS